MSDNSYCPDCKHGALAHSSAGCLSSGFGFGGYCPCRRTSDELDAARGDAAYSMFPRQTCTHCLGEHPGRDCPEPDLFSEVGA